jgi:hypothetical protein
MICVSRLTARSWFSWRVFSLARSTGKGGEHDPANINLKPTSAKIACRPEFAVQRST